MLHFLYNILLFYYGIPFTVEFLTYCRHPLREDCFVITVYFKTVTQSQNFGAQAVNKHSRINLKCSNYYFVDLRN